MNIQECPATVEVKSCNKCLQQKAIGEFYPKVKRPDGSVRYMAWCKACENKAGAARYERRKDQVLARCKEYREQNKEKVAAYLRDWYVRNRDTVIAKTRAYQSQPHRKDADKARLAKSYLDRRETIRAKQNAYNATPEGRERQRMRYAKHYELNKTYYVAKGSTRRATTIRATPPWSSLDDVICFYEEAKRLTLETGVKHVVDHIIPLTHKKVCGLHVPANLQVIPEMENLSKFNHFDG